MPPTPALAPAAPKKDARPFIPPDAASLAANGRDLANKPSLNQRFDMEAGVIAGMITDLELDTYIDLGCWYGFLLSKVLARCRVRRAVAVEAIPGIMAFARTHVPDTKVEWTNAAVIPAAMASSTVSVSVHPWDTSRSGLFVEGGTPVAGVKAAPIGDLLARLGREEVANAYLKIDLEGIDDLVVVDLLNAGYRPAVIHFEVLPKDFAGGGAVAALEQAGYQVPRLQKVGVHSLYSCVCAKGRSKLIAFAPDQVYG